MSVDIIDITPKLNNSSFLSMSIKVRKWWVGREVGILWVYCELGSYRDEPSVQVERDEKIEFCKYMKNEKKGRDTTMDGLNPNVLAQKLEALRALMPEVFIEGKLDVKVLEKLFRPRGVDGVPLEEVLSETEERFGITWQGKEAMFDEIAKQSHCTLTLDSTKSSEAWEESGNVFIEGENLEALRTLQKSYFGKVKMIYIDPPYNTGKDFVYHDNFAQTEEEYCDECNVSENGHLTKAHKLNTRDSGRFHSNWLSMMYPRLFLAKNLLRDDGVIFVSIDDNEVHNLRAIMNEIFGEENFIAQLVWNNEGNIDNQSKIKVNHEYVILFAKNSDLLHAPNILDPNIEETSKLYNQEIENSITKNGPANPISKIKLPVGFPTISEELLLPIQSSHFPHVLSEVKAKNFELTNETELESGWSSKNLLELFIKNGCVPILDSKGKETTFSLTDTGAIYMYKKRPDEQSHFLSVLRNFGTTKQNSGMLAAWGLDFNYPKPYFLIQYLIAGFSEHKDIILDFFAGSGTTAHAVMAQNVADGGKRQYICVQMPEETPEGSEARKAGYEKISDIALERIKRAAAKIKAENKEEVADFGVRYYKASDSHFPVWYARTFEKNEDLMQAIIDYTSTPYRGTPRERADEVLLKLGYPLTTTLVGHGGWCLTEDGSLALALDETLPVESLMDILPHRPTTVVVIETIFTKDEDKINFDLRCGEKGIIFQTV